LGFNIELGQVSRSSGLNKLLPSLLQDKWQDRPTAKQAQYMLLRSHQQPDLPQAPSKAVPKPAQVKPAQRPSLQDVQQDLEAVTQAVQMLLDDQTRHAEHTSNHSQVCMSNLLHTGYVACLQDAIGQ